MPISIKNAETERLARELAKETAEGITEVIRNALEDRWERLKGLRRTRMFVADVEDILRRVDAMPTLDTRSEEQILGYEKQRGPGGGR